MFSSLPDDMLADPFDSYEEERAVWLSYPVDLKVSEVGNIAEYKAEVQRKNQIEDEKIKAEEAQRRLEGKEIKKWLKRRKRVRETDDDGLPTSKWEVDEDALEEEEQARIARIAKLESFQDLLKLENLDLD